MQPKVRVELFPLYSLSHLRNSSYSSLIEPSKIIGSDVDAAGGALKAVVVIGDSVVVPSIARSSVSVALAEPEGEDGGLVNSFASASGSVGLVSSVAVVFRTTLISRMPSSS